MKIIGIIYKYTSPSGKIYIGQTIHERKRRSTFLNDSLSYAGDKINNARRKYSPENFKYEVLESSKYENIQECSISLNNLECYYIGLYDSYKHGYNMSIGGEGSVGYKMSKTQKEKHIHRMTTNNPFKGKTHSDVAKNLIGEANSKAVLQIDKVTGEVIQEFPSAKAAGEHFSKPKANSEIVKVCKKYVSPTGRRYLTALGYKWEYKNN